MAIYHLSVKIISRGSGRSAVAASAYRSGEKLYNDRDGLTHDYRRKSGVEHTEIMAPSHAPEWVYDRRSLWNAVEKVESRANSRLAREVQVALPCELDKDSQLKLLREYVKASFVDKGMVADFAIHDNGDGNPHAHIMLTTRPFELDGSWGDKARMEYTLDEQGNKTYTAAGNARSVKVSTTDWDRKETLDNWRLAWAEHCNKALERVGSTERIDHRSLAAQGIDRIPTVHLGPNVIAMEQRGIDTDRGNQYREIAEINAELAELKAEHTVALDEYKALKAEKEQQAAAPDKWLYFTPDERRAVLDARNIMPGYVNLDTVRQELSSVETALTNVQTKTREVQSERERLSSQEYVVSKMQVIRNEIDNLGMFQKLRGTGRHLEAQLMELDKTLHRGGFASFEDYKRRKQEFEQTYPALKSSLELQAAELKGRQDTLLAAKTALERASAREAHRANGDILWVQLQRKEGHSYELGARAADDMRQANAQLRSWAKTAPESGRGHLCEYTVRLASGETISGVFRMTQYDAARPNLAQRILHDQERRAAQPDRGNLATKSSDSLFQSMRRESAQVKTESARGQERASAVSSVVDSLFQSMRREAAKADADTEREEEKEKKRKELGMERSW